MTWTGKDSAISAMPEMPWPAEMRRESPCRRIRRRRPATPRVVSSSADDAQEVGSRRDELLALIRPERATVAEEVDRLEQAGLARAVRPRRSRCLADRTPGDAARMQRKFSISIASQHIARAALRAASASRRTWPAASSRRSPGSCCSHRSARARPRRLRSPPAHPAGSSR